MTRNQKYSLFIEDLQHIGHSLAARINLYEKKSIFLVGCTAFMGKWLIDALLWLNEQYALQLNLTVLTRNRNTFLSEMPHLQNHDCVRFLDGGIMDFDADALPPFELAIHGLNLHNDGTSSWAARHMTTATQGTERLYRLAAERGCKTVLMTSSGAVYGTGPVGGTMDGRLCEENAPPNPFSEPRVYGETKRFLESYASALGEQYHITTVVARCFAFSGAHVTLGVNALGSFVADALAGRNIVIKGDGTPVRSFLYGADMAAWLLALLVAGRHATPYNVGSRHGVNLKQLAKTILHCAGLDKDVVVEGTPLQGNAPACYVPGIARIEHELGLKEGYSLEDGLYRMLEWHNMRQTSSRRLK